MVGLFERRRKNWIKSKPHGDGLMKAISAIFITVALALMVPFSANANLITNGSFENPDIPTGTWQVLNSISGWATTVGPGIEIQDHVAGSPFAGNQHVELDSNSNSGMIQTAISTLPGQQCYHRLRMDPPPTEMRTP